MSISEKTGFKFLAVFAVFASVFSFISFAEDFSSSQILESYALDTVAGYSTNLRTSQTVANSKVIFQVITPKGELVEASAYSDGEGVAKAELSDYYTRTAGTYEVSAYVEGVEVISRSNSFVVYPDSVSGAFSTLSPTDQVVHISDEQGAITVKLMDQYKNPIEGHLVKLIASADSNISNSGSDMTDMNGEVNFNVSADSAGNISYSAYDVNSDMILDQRADVAYFDSAQALLSNASYRLASSSGSASGPIDHFEFKNISTSIRPNETTTFTLEAQDAADQAVINYLGKVRFSAVSDNAFFANLPEDYTFTVNDLGAHTFTLAVSFQQPGVYEVEARDLDNTEVYGTGNFTVTQSSSQGSQGSGITLSNPVPGTYSNNVQVISGKASPAAKLKILDNDVEIASITADISGNFTFTTNLLIDGLHSFYVVQVNDVGTVSATSQKVEVNIDTGTPEIKEVVIEPSGVITPGGVVTVKAYVSEQLSQAAIVFNNNIYELTQATEGYYMGNFVAPVEFGNYPLNFVLVDELGNETRIENEHFINVGGLGDSNAIVSDVTGLTATGADHRVSLTWTAVANAVNGVKNYRVYFGLSPNQLTEAVDTFTNATTWYVPNLKGNTEYYFAVVAVDTLGNISEHFSNIVSATPISNVVEVTPPDVKNGMSGGDAIKDMESDVSETGPEMIWLVLISALGGVFYSVSAKKRAFSKREIE